MLSQFADVENENENENGNENGNEAGEDSYCRVLKLGVFFFWLAGFFFWCGPNLTFSKTGILAAGAFSKHAARQIFISPTVFKDPAGQSNPERHKM